MTSSGVIGGGSGSGVSATGDGDKPLGNGEALIADAKMHEADVKLDSQPRSATTDSQSDCDQDSVDSTPDPATQAALTYLAATRPWRQTAEQHGLVSAGSMVAIGSSSEGTLASPAVPVIAGAGQLRAPTIISPLLGQGLAVPVFRCQNCLYLCTIGHSWWACWPSYCRDFARGQCQYAQDTGQHCPLPHLSGLDIQAIYCGMRPVPDHCDNCGQDGHYWLACPLGYCSYYLHGRCNYSKANGGKHCPLPHIKPREAWALHVAGLDASSDKPNGKSGPRFSTMTSQETKEPPLPSEMTSHDSTGVVGSLKPSEPTSVKPKITPCKFFPRGCCINGNQCRFSHSIID